MIGSWTYLALLSIDGKVYQTKHEIIGIKGIMIETDEKFFIDLPEPIIDISSGGI